MWSREMRLAVSTLVLESWGITRTGFSIVFFVLMLAVDQEFVSFVKRRQVDEIVQGYGA